MELALNFARRGDLSDWLKEGLGFGTQPELEPRTDSMSSDANGLVGGKAKWPTMGSNSPAAGNKTADDIRRKALVSDIKIFELSSVNINIVWHCLSYLLLLLL